MGRELWADVLILNQGIYFGLVVDSVYILQTPIGIDNDLLSPKMIVVYNRDYLTH